jgi:hypothetical protein
MRIKAMTVVDAFFTAITKALAVGKGSDAHRASVFGDRERGHFADNAESDRHLNKQLAEQSSTRVYSFGWRGLWYN